MINSYRPLKLSSVLLSLLIATHIFASEAWSQSFNIQASGSMEVAFSPNEGSETLVLKVTNSTQKEILMLAYSFTSTPVTEALISARHRGVIVRIVVDNKENIEGDRYGKSRASLSALKNAGVDVRTISTYPIQHDKFVISDRQTVELGSFNYSSAAAHKNSENVLVNWRNPELASIYIDHFNRNYRQSTEYVERY